MRKIFLLLLPLLFLLSCGSSDSASDTKKVTDAMDAFVNVYVDKEDAILDKIISHDPDIVFYTFGTTTMKGYKSIRKTISKSIEKVEDSDIEIRDRKVKIDGDIAWFSQRGDWNYDWDNQHIEAKGIRMTGVLQKKDGGWKIVQWHTSMPQRQ